eukprot:CAMPEP_0113566892 /NCGR_PEP_ID=MMETSP0015_2-20120614/22974_1 /TAXON_ID=2838 /ORGANISM="Odontella" /LENGTH=54 /DNA_ID=CAMNT_0000469229 /DNA_START=22 /DNA_END=182 /DNA_ORIENTATION=+ /assembly_acc=CAM_ASM_000160
MTVASTGERTVIVPPSPPPSSLGGVWETIFRKRARWVISVPWVLELGAMRVTLS